MGFPFTRYPNVIRATRGHEAHMLPYDLQEAMKTYSGCAREGEQWDYTMKV